MSHDFDLEAYFARIGYTGEQTATLSTLQAIHARHPAAIPFENLNPLLGMPVALDIASLQQKLIEARRGGYCFEHNLLLKGALDSLGYGVTCLAARVVWGRTAEAITPRSHMLLLVDLGERQYIADVGFGGQTLTAPLPFELDLEHETPHEPFKLTKLGSGDYLLETKIRDEWKPLYKFDLQPQALVDYEVTSWYLSHHPQSPFTMGLRAARAIPGRRYGLSNNALSIHTPGTGTESRTIDSVAALKDTLETLIGVRLPEHPALDQTLGRLL